jgi:hypothetical protein
VTTDHVRLTSACTPTPRGSCLPRMVATTYTATRNRRPNHLELATVLEQTTALTPMPTTITKGKIVEAVASLPDDATLDDAIERLLFLSKIEQGLDETRRGETIPHEEVRRRLESKIASWQK